MDRIIIEEQPELFHPNWDRSPQWWWTISTNSSRDCQAVRFCDIELITFRASLQAPQRGVFALCDRIVLVLIHAQDRVGS